MMTMGVAPEAVEDRIPGIARAFIDSLDRSSLGGFAADEHTLYLMLVEELRVVAINAAETADENESGILFDRFTESTAEVNAYANPSERANTSRELDFWMEMASEPDGAEMNALYHSVISERTGHSKHFALIAAHPDMHDYFAAGFWDTDFIRLCLDGGIDAELALTLR